MTCMVHPDLPILTAETWVVLKRRIVAALDDPTPHHLLLLEEAIAQMQRCVATLDVAKQASIGEPQIEAVQ